jgi:hypothetical protein
MYKAPVFLRKLLKRPASGPWRNRKYPDDMKKNGTATRATILVSIKSAVPFTMANGDVWMATTRTAAISLKLSIPV